MKRGMEKDRGGQRIERTREVLKHEGDFFVFLIILFRSSSGRIT